METIVRDDILNIIKQGIDGIKRKDNSLLREISDHCIHNASIFQDKDSITIAVIMYAISKLGYRVESAEQELTVNLETALNFLEQNNFQGYEETIKQLLDKISGIDQRINLYIQKVLNDAEIKKGSRIYEHGISLAQTADLLGITQWELMKYIGKTNISEQFKDPIPVNDRLNYTRTLFNLEIKQ